jgi:Tfp pilus assembly protein PilF
VFLVLCVFAVAACPQTSHIETAAQLLSNGDMAQAEAEARKAMQISSTRALALAMLGTIRLQQGKTEESTKFLVQALDLNPKLVGARTTLGSLRAGKPDLAAKCFREVLRIDPANLMPVLTVQTGGRKTPAVPRFGCLNHASVARIR